MGAVLKRHALVKPISEVGCGNWNDLSGMLLPESEEQRVIDDVLSGRLGTIDDVLERFKNINDDYNELRWTWSYKMICNYYGISEITEEDAERVRQDYVEARRAWIAEIRRDAEKEFPLGDVEEDVLNEFIRQLDGEVDFENQKLYM